MIFVARFSRNCQFLSKMLVGRNATLKGALLLKYEREFTPPDFRVKTRAFSERFGGFWPVSRPAPPLAFAGGFQ